MKTTHENEGLIVPLDREKFIESLTARRKEIVAFYDPRVAEGARLERLHRERLSVTPRWRLLRRSGMRDDIEKVVRQRRRDIDACGYRTRPIDAVLSMLEISTESSIQVGAGFYRTLTMGTD